MWTFVFVSLRRMFRSRVRWGYIFSLHCVSLSGLSPYLEVNPRWVNGDEAGYEGVEWLLLIALRNAHGNICHGLMWEDDYPHLEDQPPWKKRASVKDNFIQTTDLLILLLSMLQNDPEEVNFLFFHIAGKVTFLKPSLVVENRLYPPAKRASSYITHRPRHHAICANKGANWSYLAALPASVSSVTSGPWHTQCPRTRCGYNHATRHDDPNIRTRTRLHSRVLTRRQRGVAECLRSSQLLAIIRERGWKYNIRYLFLLLRRKLYAVLIMKRCYKFRNDNLSVSSNFRGYKSFCKRQLTTQFWPSYSHPLLFYFNYFPRITKAWRWCGKANEQSGKAWNQNGGM